MADCCVRKGGQVLFNGFGEIDGEVFQLTGGVTHHQRHLVTARLKCNNRCTVFAIDAWHTLQALIALLAFFATPRDALRLTIDDRKPTVILNVGVAVFIGGGFIKRATVAETRLADALPAI